MSKEGDGGGRRLYLLRHAKSSWADAETQDFDRPLNERGKSAGKLLGAHLATQPRPDLILCSSAKRTRQTLELVLPAWKKKPEILLEDRLYLASARKLMARLEELPESCRTALVIGHNPGLHDLALALAQHGPKHDRHRLAEKFPTGALVSFRLEGEWYEVSNAPIALVGFVTPSDLRGDAEEAD